MSRGLLSPMKSATSSAQVSPFNLVHIAFDSGDLRIWTGNGTLSWGGYDWVGANAVIGISSPSENTEVEAKGVTISLSGLPAEILLIALDEQYQGRLCTVYFGAMAGTTIVSSPTISFRGRIDDMPINDTGESSTISVVVKNRLVSLHRSRNRRWTDADHKMDYPDDRGLGFIQPIQEQKINWGQ